MLATRDSRHQVYLVTILQNLVQFGHAAIDHKQQSLRLQIDIEVIQQIGHAAARWKRDINPADGSIGGLNLQDGMQVYNEIH